MQGDIIYFSNEDFCEWRKYGTRGAYVSQDTNDLWLLTKNGYHLKIPKTKEIRSDKIITITDNYKDSFVQSYIFFKDSKHRVIGKIVSNLKGNFLLNFNIFILKILFDNRYLLNQIIM